MHKVRFSASSLALIVAHALAVPAAAQTYTTVAQPQSDADALAAAIRTLGSSPQNLDALITAGELSLRVGDASGAAALFARAEKVDPRNGRVKAGMAAILVHEERPGEALRYYDQAVGYGLDPARFAAERGLAYDLIGQPDRAQRDYRVALRSGGANNEVIRRYALSLGISGKQDLALQALDPLLRKSDRGAWRARAFILAMTGDVGGASRIATSMMPPGMAQGLQPFFERLPKLSAADRAFAVHFGEVRPTPERLADARMTPALPALGPDPTAPVQMAAKPAQPVVQVASKDDRKARRSRGRKGKIEAVQVAQAAPVPAAATLPQPPAYGTAAAGGTVFAAARPVVQALPGVSPAPAAAPPAQPQPRAPVQLASTGMTARPPVSGSVAPVEQRLRESQAARSGFSAAPVTASAIPVVPGGTAQPARVAATSSPAASLMATPSMAAVGSSVPPATASVLLPTAGAATASRLPGASQLPGRATPATVAAAMPTAPRAVLGAGGSAVAGPPSPATSTSSAGLAPSTALAGTGVAAAAPLAATPLMAAAGSSVMPATGSTLPRTAGAETVNRSPGASQLPGRAAPAAVAAAMPTTPRAVPGAGSVAVASLTSPATSVPTVGRAPSTAPASTGFAAASPVALTPRLPAASAAVTSTTPVPPRISEDSILAKIIAGISIPESELNAAATPQPAPARAVAAQPSVVAGRTAAAPVVAPKPGADELAATRAKAAAEKKALARKKADADKKALADKKAAAEKKQLADEKAAAEKLAKADPPRIWVQVAGGANQSDLPKAWSSAKDKAKALSGKTAYSTPLRATNRVVTGPFKTDAEARAFVNTLAKQGVSAFTFTSEKGQKMTRLSSK